MGEDSLHMQTNLAGKIVHFRLDPVWPLRLKCVSENFSDTHFLALSSDQGFSQHPSNLSFGQAVS